MLTHLNSTLLIWRGATVRLDPVHYAYVYLIHFSRPIGNPEKTHGLAGHYLGSTCALDHRLQLHKNGNGAALMAAVGKAGISWQLVRLWRFETAEEARAWEKRLKRRGHNPHQCPVCQNKPFDALTFMRQGHWPFFLFATPGRRASMGEARPHFVRRLL
jgi:predicted GIY-YIG superfamily endonuclease